MRKYPQIQKVTDFDLLECLTHGQYKLNEKGIITTVLYQTKNYQLLSRYYLYKNKTIISIHDKTGYTETDANEFNISELYDILAFFKGEGFDFILKSINGNINQEIHFTGYGILGAYMQIYFRYIMSTLDTFDRDLSSLNLYCTTFQTTSIDEAMKNILKEYQKNISEILNTFTNVANLELAERIRLYMRKVKDSHPFFLPSLLLDPLYLKQELFDIFLETEYRKIKDISFIKKIIMWAQFKTFPSFQDFQDQQIFPHCMKRIEKQLEKIESLAEDCQLLSGIVSSDHQSNELIHSRSISLIKDDTFLSNKYWVKANKIAISYNIHITKKVPVEFFYLFLKEYMITTNNKLNVEILTAIFREYLYKIYESDHQDSDKISYDDILNTCSSNQTESKLYRDWLENKFSGKFSDLVTIILTNNTDPFKIYRYNKVKYCIIGSELAFDYYYKIVDLLEINPHAILKIKIGDKK